jgi:type I restriction enzyme S subunit
MMEELQSSRSYRRDECAIFLKTHERYGGLSNMAGGYPLSINGIRILTSEALYQACRFPHLPDVQKLIIGQASPMTAKMKSKPNQKDSRPDWNDVRVLIMRWCLRVKLAQHWEKFGDLLLSTGNQPIVEESYRDPFWGAKPVDGQTLVGMNVLGQLLTELREQLKCNADELRVIEPPDLSQFLLIEKPIGIIERPSATPHLLGMSAASGMSNDRLLFPDGDLANSAHIQDEAQVKEAQNAARKTSVASAPVPPWIPLNVTQSPLPLDG